MPEEIKADLEACKSCKVGSCCYEGVDLKREEMKRILKYNPDIPKPWFRVLSDAEVAGGEEHFATVVRSGTCVFQDKDNRCAVYKVRPQYCRDFPLENNKTAPHYRRLCVLFHKDWARNSGVLRTYNQRENNQ